MRRRWMAPLALVSALLLGGGVRSAPAPALATQAAAVSLQGDRFLPDVIVVAAGTTVTWTNDEADPTNGHNITSAQGNLLASPIIYTGTSWSFTFDTPGEYAYYCDLHEGMMATVIVQ